MDSKYEFGKTQLEYLSHVLDEHSIRPSEDKARAIQEIPTPTPNGQALGLLGTSKLLWEIFATAEHSLGTTVQTAWRKCNLEMDRGRAVCLGEVQGPADKQPGSSTL